MSRSSRPARGCARTSTFGRSAVGTLGALILTISVSGCGAFGADDSAEATGGATETASPASQAPASQTPESEAEGASLVADPDAIRLFANPGTEILSDVDLADYLLPGLSGPGRECVTEDIDHDRVLDADPEVGAQSVAALVTQCVPAESIGAVFAMYAVGFDAPDTYDSVSSCLTEDMADVDVVTVREALADVYAERLDLYGPVTSPMVAAQRAESLTGCDTGRETEAAVPASSPPSATPTPTPTRVPTPTNTIPVRNVPWSFVAAGDCTNNPLRNSPQVVEVIPCDGKHRFEAVGSKILVNEEPASVCSAMVDRYAKRSWSGSIISISETGAGSLKKVVCFIGRGDRAQTRGSLAR